MKTAHELIEEARKRITEVHVTDLKQVMKNNTVILIDVREPDEFKAGAIPGALNYPRGVLEMKIHQHPSVSDHEQPLAALEYLSQQAIYLVCGTGGRSALATDALQSMGFQQVNSVQGGYQAWLAAGYEVVR